MKNILLILVCFHFSCQAQSSIAEKTIKTETTFRLLADGEKSYESYKEFDTLGNLTFIRDYMDGKPYLMHWYELDSTNHAKLKFTSSCDTCKKDTTYFHYSQKKLIKTTSKMHTSVFYYDENGNQVKELELFTNSGYIRRIKIMAYNGNKLSSKTSYDFSQSNFLPESINIDSLISKSTPYHQYKNIYDTSGKITESHWSGSISDWFAIHKHFYDDSNRPTRVDYFSEKGVSGGSRIYEYTFY